MVGLEAWERKKGSNRVVGVGHLTSRMPFVLPKKYDTSTGLLHVFRPVIVVKFVVTSSHRLYNSTGQ